MVTKMTAKHQITIPRRILIAAGLNNLKKEEMYFAIEARNRGIFLKPVTVTIEERIPDEQWQKFETQVTKTEKGDKVFNSSQEASMFLKKRVKNENRL